MLFHFTLRKVSLVLAVTIWFVAQNLSVQVGGSLRPVILLVPMEVVGILTASQGQPVLQPPVEYLKFLRIEMAKTYLVLMCSLIAVLGCDKFTHPNTQFFEEIESGALTIGLDSTYQAYPEDLSFLFNETEIIKLESISSKINDVQFLDIQTSLLGDNLIFVVSEGIKSVFVYNFKGKLLYRIGREGRGPGEFTKIKHIAYDDGTGLLYVLDNNEVEIFESYSSGFQFLKTKTLRTVSNYGICSFDNKVYLAGIGIEEDKTNKTVTSSNLIKVFDQTLDTVITTFGKPYRSYSKNPVLDALLSKGELLCNEENESITYIFSDYGFGIEFENSGKPKLVFEFLGFSPRKIEEINVQQPRNAGITYLDSDNINVFASSQSLDNYRLFQIGSMSFARNLEEIITSNQQVDKEQLKPLNIIVNVKTKEKFKNYDINYRILSMNDQGALIAEYEKVSEGIYEPILHFKRNE